MSKVNSKVDHDVVLNTFNKMSTKIRYLNSIGMSRGDISRKLKIRYQWVRNVLITEVKDPQEKF